MEHPLLCGKSPQRHWHRGVLLVLGLILSHNSAASASTNPEPGTQVTTAMRELQSFNSTHSLSTLGTAIDTLGRAADLHAIAPEDFVTSRRSLMQAWARILQTIEQSYDPTYDPNDPRQRAVDCVPCTFPQGSPTADEQPAYQAAVQANNVKIARSQHYLQVHQLDELAMANVRIDLRLFEMAGAPPDYAALDTIFRQANLSEARLSAIDTMLNAP